jgi:ubiquinone/menaquinone biosynthesis C-methylase UbiE
LGKPSGIWSVNPLNYEIRVNIKQQVQDFYNEVGWQEISEGVYQNATFEDLRPVSREYIHRCHLRVLRHLNAHGKYLLDAGSGPIQYPEYLEYSQGYQYRVCVDISVVALQEARKRIGKHGLFVIADIAHLPFRSEVFEGGVSLHTIHHLPLEDHLVAYEELFRVLKVGSSTVVVNGWKNPPVERWMRAFGKVTAKLSQFKFWQKIETASEDQPAVGDLPEPDRPGGKTFVSKYDAAWFKKVIGKRLPCEIWVWRSVSVGIMRTLIPENRFGRWLLSLIYRLEELFPHYLGENGVYPMVVIRKAD